ncbi:WASH complex subunit 4 [Diorhabda sublineata]|uniref:WASH complex subunit 4 n=1 Tax=Diorhabda sublineata TaxID=1163346 RepID=UPI0024E15754|nr:WASH complex subunit 4 [Diorhabda sublineata]
MWEPSNLVERQFNAETSRLIGEAQLHEYGSFLETYTERISKQKDEFCNKYSIAMQVITIEDASPTRETVAHLIYSDNKILSRILATLGGLCDEMSTLISEVDELYAPFVLYEDTFDKVSRQASISKILEPLHKINLFVKRVQTIFILCLRQISCLLVKHTFSSSHFPAFPEVLHKLGDLLICLLKFDHILDNQILRDHWFWYKKSIRNISHSNKLNVDKNKMRYLDKMLQILENNLLTGHILKIVIEKCFEDKNFYYQMKNCTLNQEVHLFITYLLTDLEKNEDVEPNIWLKMNVFVIFYFSIFENNDRKILKRVLDINKKHSACTLIGNIIWYPEKFLLKHFSILQKYIDERAIENNRLNLISVKTSNFPKESSIICLNVCYFLMELEKISKLDTNNIKSGDFNSIVNSLNNGIKLLKKINFSVQWILNLHADKNLPLQKSVLLSVCKLIELLKCIPLICKKYTITLTHIILLTTQHLSYKTLALVTAIRKGFTQEKSYNEWQLDVLSSLNLCEQVLKAPPTSRRLLIANLALSASGLYSNDFSKLKQLLQQLEMIINFSKTLRELSCCSFIRWHSSYMLPIYFTKIVQSKLDLSRHSLILYALNDFSNELTDKIVEDKFYEPIEQIIERQIRLQTHLHLQLPPIEPFENYFSINFNKYLPIPVHNVYKNIKIDAEHHLSTMFYNLTSVVLHNWKTYGEMRRLAYLQYGLETIDDNLPIQTLEQGLDVLEIMRNINIFASKYLYNLNSQVFIERNSENKHLNSINISQVANSIRTHGIGIMNTTVNFTYQFLRNKFYIFSQFIYDELIKSRLIKDSRFFSEYRIELDQMYPYERAEKFNVGIRKLGLNQQGESYLDLFRKVITQIGNAMGYVRLMRSGCRRCLADGTCFIPDLKKKNLAEVIENAELPDLTRKAAGKVIEILNTYLDNIEDITEYFQLLVKVFVPVLRNKSNLHLKYFFIIVPPLTINYIEYSLNCKDRLNKRNKTEYAFTDDGFALGLAYIIEILNQEEQVNGLHWFQSVQKKINNDKIKIKEQISDANNSDNKLRQTLLLTEKKLNAHEREFKLLYYGYNSARLFFQTQT